VRHRLCTLLQALRLPVTYTGIAPQALLDVMAHDKKAVAGVVRFILLKDIGAVAYHQEVPFATLQALLASHA
jgi:3-dehydroquinate synthetase